MRPFVRVLLLTAAALPLALSARAQSSTTPETAAQATTPGLPPSAQASVGTGGIEEIVVTAQKRAQNLIDVPLAVQAITGATLERTGTKDIEHLVDFIPGASVVSAAAPGFETIQIRGVSAGTVGDATTGYYVDDVVFSIPNLQIAPPSRLFDLERTEILRGPQGTLYGAGAMGGLVRLITAQPDTHDFHLRGQGEVSGTESGGTNYAVDGVVNVPIAKDVAGLRVSGGYEKLSGFADSAEFPGRNLNDAKLWNVRGKLFVKPTDRLDVTLSVWHIDSYQNYNNNLNTVKPYRLPSVFGTKPFNSVISTFYSGSLKYDAGPVSIESGTSYLDHKLDFDTTVNTAAINLRATADFKSRSFSQELRVLSKGKSPFNWIVGGIYTDAKIDSQFDYTVPIFGLQLPLITQQRSPLTTESFAVFGEASYSLFGGKLIPLVGLRYFNDVRRANGTTLLYPTLAPPPLTLPSSGRARFDSFNPRFNLSYKPNSDTTVYFNAAKGFRSGSVQTQGQVIFAGLDGVATSLIIQPDSLWSYELGVKRRSPDRHLSIELAGYYTDWSNIQLPFTTSAGLVATTNGGDARLYGVDLSLAWRTPLDGLSLQFTGNVNKSEFSRVDRALAARLVTARDNAQLPGVPRGNLSVGATYAKELRPGLDLDLYGDYSYRAAQSDLGSGLYSGDLHQVALRAGLDTGKLRVTLFAENLLNERGPVAVTSVAQQPLYPRRAGISVAVKY